MAIAAVISTTLADPGLRVEVSRRDRTLHVFLTLADPTHLDQPVQGVRDAITALAPAGITDLKILDGTDRRLVNRWQYDYSLPPASPTPDRLNPDSSTAPIPIPAQGGPPRGRKAAIQPDKPVITRRGRWRRFVVPTAIALGLGLAAGMAQRPLAQRSSLDPDLPPLDRSTEARTTAAQIADSPLPDLGPASSPAPRPTASG